MTYLSTNPANPAAPLWMFHLLSFTLAELHLSVLPGGKHLLTVDAATPPPDEAIQSFAATLESMDPGASDHLAVITRENLASELPEFMYFTPATPSDCLVSFSPRHGLATVHTTAGVSHHWRSFPESPEQALKIAAEAHRADEEFIRTHLPPRRQAT